MLISPTETCTRISLLTYSQYRLVLGKNLRKWTFLFINRIPSRTWQTVETQYKWTLSHLSVVNCLINLLRLLVRLISCSAHRQKRKFNYKNLFLSLSFVHQKKEKEDQILIFALICILEN